MNYRPTLFCVALSMSGLACAQPALFPREPPQPPPGEKPAETSTTIPVPNPPQKAAPPRGKTRRTVAQLGIVIGGMTVLFSPAVLAIGSRDAGWGLTEYPNSHAAFGLAGAGAAIVIFSAILYGVDF